MEKIKEILYKKFYSSSLDETELTEALDIIKNSKNTKKIKFSLENLYLYSGLSFLLSSILFFIAYNLKIINDITKILLMYAVISVPFILYFFKFKEQYRKILLFSLCFLIGVLFAVFGQVYQTGADSYWLFVSWSMAIIPMVLISEFFPCYILHFIVMYTAFILFGVQEKNYMFLSTFGSLFPLIIYGVLYKFKRELSLDKWLFNFLISGIFVFHFFYIPVIGVTYYRKSEFFMALVIYILTMLYFQHPKKGIGKSNYTKIISLVPFFPIIPVVIGNIFNNLALFLFILLMIIAAYTALIKRISYVRKAGDNE